MAKVWLPIYSTFTVAQLMEVHQVSSYYCGKLDDIPTFRARNKGSEA